MAEMELDIKSQQIREVFANYGLALYQAQCLEKQIAILLGGKYEIKPQKLTRYRYDEILDSHMEHTFGKLVHDLQSKMNLSSDINNKLELAVEQRNWLAHFYWWDRVSEFNYHNGRELMLDELKKIATLFEELDEYFVAIAKNWLNDIGVTQEILDTCQTELLAKPTPTREGKRKLKYFYKPGDARGTVIFELDDHTYWTLCDCGLTYGMANIAVDHLIPDKKFAGKLPASINPKPRDAANWNYRIQLSTGFYIRVTPCDDNEGFVCKWGLYSGKDNRLIKSEI